MTTMKPHFPLLAVITLLFGIASPAMATGFDLDQVSTLRLRGELETAQLILAAEITTTDVSPDQRIEQHLEMARIQDRMGLHYNTRPVADAVHLLGLMKFHRKKLDLAEALFEESLRLDILAGERVFFRGEYERHVGYIAYQRGDFESAVRHFERSLEARIEAGAIDASMFAAISLASVLIESGHPDEAKPHLDYALAIAQEMDSPVGLKRVNEAMERWSAAPVPDVK